MAWKTRGVLQLLRGVAVLAAGLISACGGRGSAKIEGDIGGYKFELSTIYGWIDEMEQRSEQGKTTFVLRDEPRLFLVFSGASYDPEADLRLVSPADLEELAFQESLKGKINARLTKYNQVTTGQVAMSGPGDGPNLDVEYSFKINELDAEAVFPSEVPIYGSKFTGRLTFKEAGKKAEESVSGTLELIVEAEAGDPAGARTGKVTLEFDAPLIHERIAECNNGQSRTDRTCEPEYPRGN